MVESNTVGLYIDSTAIVLNTPFKLDGFMKQPVSDLGVYYETLLKFHGFIMIDQMYRWLVAYSTAGNWIWFIVY